MKKILYLIILLNYCSGCEKEVTETPYKIDSLIEIIDGNNVDKTNEIMTCKLDDEFFFSKDLGFNILEGETDCSPKLGRLRDFTYDVIQIDSLESEFLEIELPGSVIGYFIHDSMRLSKTENQWNNRENQLYKIIEFNESSLIIQNDNCLSKPKTQHLWQIQFKK